MLHQLINTATDYLHAHPEMGILFAFVTALLESLPLIGTIIPGSLTMTAVGAMIGAGMIPGYITLAIASLGALVGDFIGFAIGSIFKERLRTVWPFRKYPKMILMSESFVKKHGGKSILIGRFVGPARSAVPMVAGALHLSWLRFTLAAIPTAILWSIVYCLPGIILGAFSTEIPAGLLTEYLIVGLLGIFLLWILFWIIQHFFTRITRYYHRQIDRCWSYLKKHRSTHWIIEGIYNHQNPQCHYQLSRLLFGFFFLILFLIILINVALHTTLTAVNQPAFDFAQSWRVYHLDPFFISLSVIGTPKILMLIAVTISFILFCLGAWRASAHLFSATVIAAAIGDPIRFAHLSLRPLGFMVVKTSSSFPSGHALLSVVILGLITFYTAQYFKNDRGIIRMIGAVFIALIGISRLYVGAHWLLDVVGSTFLGLAILFFTIVSYQRLPKATSSLQINRWIWLAILFIVSMSIEVTNLYFEYRDSVYSYTPLHPNTVTTEMRWWNHPLTLIPLYRNNRLGHVVEPINLQWSGQLDHIQKTLKEKGWVMISAHHLENTVNRLARHEAQYHLPLFAVLYKNQRPALMMFRRIPKQSAIYLLRLWDAGVEFKQEPHLWIGTISEFKAPTRLIAFTHQHITSFAHITIQNTLDLSPSDWSIKIYQAAPAEIPRKIKANDWKGDIWLIKPNSSNQ